MPLEAWYMSSDDAADQRAPHRLSPNEPVAKAQLDALGVLSWEGLDADG